jgi:hypothetical protein
VDANHVNSRAVNCRVRKILNTVDRLGTRDTSRDYSDVVFTQSNGVFEVRRYVAEPGLSGYNGPDSGPGFVLNVYTLSGVSVNIEGMAGNVPL